MRHSPDLSRIREELTSFLQTELPETALANEWPDSQWTDYIHERFAEIGRNHGYLIFTNRCQNADGPRWLYEHHWRIADDKGNLIRIPLVMEIEWGFGAATIWEKVTEDFSKLILVRADLRIIVFQGNGIESQINQLISMVESFEGTQPGDNWLFAGWGWDTEQMHHRYWAA